MYVCMYVCMYVYIYTHILYIYTHVTIFLFISVLTPEKASSATCEMRKPPATGVRAELPRSSRKLKLREGWVQGLRVEGLGFRGLGFSV